MRDKSTGNTVFKLNRRQLIASAVFAAGATKAKRGLSMAKKEEVWVCTATMIPTFGVPFIADLQLSDEERWRNGIFKNQRGEELDADWFPQESHVDPKMFDYLAKYEGKKLTYKKGLPYFFGCGYYYVSLELADVLRQFDLGNGALYPTRFFEVDGKTLTGL